MQRNLYINSGVKNVYIFGVRNIEGQNPTGHPAPWFKKPNDSKNVKEIL